MTEEIKDKDLEKAAGGAPAFRKPGQKETHYVDPTYSCDEWSAASGLPRTSERICQNCRFYDSKTSECMGAPSLN